MHWQGLNKRFIPWQRTHNNNNNGAPFRQRLRKQLNRILHHIYIQYFLGVKTVNSDLCDMYKLFHFWNERLHETDEGHNEPRGKRTCLDR